MSYDLTAKSMTRMIVQLTTLKDNTLSKVEFQGNKTFARNLRQAMVAAEYIFSAEFGDLNRKWKISQIGNRVICSLKKVENFREFKYIDTWPMAEEMIRQNQDAYVMSFPNLNPDNTNREGIDIMMKMFPEWRINRYDEKVGLVINRPVILPGNEDKAARRQEELDNPLYVKETDK